MVKEFGMSRLGKVYFREQPPPAFLTGPAWSDGDGDYSEQTAREIDMEVRKIIDDATEEVRCIVQARRKALEVVAKLLVEKEVIDGAELRKVLDENDPGPKLVPASAAIEDPLPPSENGLAITSIERKVE
jgi:cell division protease FtsH